VSECCQGELETLNQNYNSLNKVLLVTEAWTSLLIINRIKWRPTRRRESPQQVPILKWLLFWHPIQPEFMVRAILLSGISTGWTRGEQWGGITDLYEEWPPKFPQKCENVGHVSRGEEHVGRGAGHVGCISGGQDVWAEGAGRVGCSSGKARPGPVHHYLLLTAYIVLGNACTMSWPLF